MRVKFTKVFVAVLCTAFLITSCQKEESFEQGGNNPGGGGPGGGGPGGGGPGGGNTTSNIAGNYDFVGMTASTSATLTMNLLGDEMKTVTISNYTTENNTGTAKITANELIGTNIGYSINTMVNAKTYLNGQLEDEMDMPFVMTVPPTSSTSTYTRISADSIVSTGSFGGPSSPGGGPQTTQSVGVKLSWSGDTLIMKMSMTQTQNIDQGGVPATMVSAATAISKLKKK